MQWCDRIRRWLCALICGLLCIVVHGLAFAQAPADTAAPQKKTATPARSASKSTSTVAKKPAAKATHPSTGKTNTKHAPSHASATKSKNARGRKTTTTKAVAKKHGQQAIDSTRAREIQTALIREHYMQGEPSGTWDSTTQSAMQRYQADQGWQSKQIPDSRALIKLGLGPSHDHLLNPESAMTTAPTGDPKASSKQPAPESNLPKQ
jgi:hypothetical protein